MRVGEATGGVMRDADADAVQDIRAGEEVAVALAVVVVYMTGHD